MNDFIGYFMSSETPFALLFLALFFYVIKTNRERETKQAKIIEEDLKALNKDMHVLIKVWQILLEKEVQDYDKLNKH